MSVGGFLETTHTDIPPQLVGAAEERQIKEIFDPRPNSDQIRLTLDRPQAHDDGWRPQAAGAELRFVSEGFAVTPEDYDRRYGDLPLDAFRATMPPKVFAAYVRFIGAVQPPRRFDPVAATRLPEAD